MGWTCRVALLALRQNRHTGDLLAIGQEAIRATANWQADQGSPTARVKLVCWSPTDKLPVASVHGSCLVRMAPVRPSILKHAGALFLQNLIPNGYHFGKSKYSSSKLAQLNIPLPEGQAMWQW